MHRTPSRRLRYHIHPDIERQLAVRCVDRHRDGDAVSLAWESRAEAPSWVVIRIRAGGLPDGGRHLAGRSVYRDGQRFYFDDNGQPVPEWAIDYLEERPASSELAFRPLRQGEQPRINFAMLVPSRSHQLRAVG